MESMDSGSVTGATHAQLLYALIKIKFGSSEIVLKVYYCNAKSSNVKNCDEICAVNKTATDHREVCVA